MKNKNLKIGLLTGALVLTLSIFIFQNVSAATTIGDSMSTGGNFSQTGATTFSTGTGAVSLNGDTTIIDGKTLTASGGVVLGDNGDTVQINSSDWDISTTGVLEGIGNINTDGNINSSAATFAIANGTSTTVNIGGAATTLTLSGITIGSSTKLITLNGSTTTAGLLTANGQVVLGDDGDTVRINSSDWDISTTGIMEGIGDINTDGSINSSAATFAIANGTSTTVNIGGAATTLTLSGITIGSSTKLITLNGSTTTAGLLTANGQVVLGDDGDTVRINSSDWDISTTGIMEGIGDINTDGNINTSATNVQIANGTSTTVRIGGAATTLLLSGITVGSSTQSIVLNGTTTIVGSHLKFTQATAPQISATPSNCGTGSPTATATLSADSTDGAGTITLTIGGGSPTRCDTTITFNKAYASTPKAIYVSSGWRNDTGFWTHLTAASASSFTFVAGTNPTASLTYTVHYIVIE